MIFDRVACSLTSMLRTKLASLQQYFSKGVMPYLSGCNNVTSYNYSKNDNNIVERNFLFWNLLRNKKNTKEQVDLLRINVLSCLFKQPKTVTKLRNGNSWNFRGTEMLTLPVHAQSNRFFQWMQELDDNESKMCRRCWLHCALSLSNIYCALHNVIWHT